MPAKNKLMNRISPRRTFPATYLSHKRKLTAGVIVIRGMV